MPSKLPLLSVFACLLVFVIGVGSVVADDRASLQGVWIAQSHEADGGKHNLPTEQVKRVSYVFKGNSLSCRLKDKDEGDKEKELEPQVRYEIDATKSPKHIDLLVPNGKPAVGIYDIKGNELKLCMSEGVDERPTEFSTKLRSKTVLIVFKRMKAK